MKKDIEPKIFALKKQIESGNFTSNAGAILNHIKKQTNFAFHGSDDVDSEVKRRNRGTDMTQLENKFQLKQSTITSAVSNLEDLGLIFKDGTKEKNGYKYSLFYHEPNEFKQAQNRQNRHFAKFKSIMERLDKEFPEMISQALKMEMEKSLNAAKNPESIQGSLFA